MNKYRTVLEPGHGSVIFAGSRVSVTDPVSDLKSALRHSASSNDRVRTKILILNFDASARGNRDRILNV